MKRSDMEHIIRACGALTNLYEFVVIGSQSILGSCPSAPEGVLISRELDIYPKDHPELSDLITGSIGEGSLFDQRFGYHADGVDTTTANLPLGWTSRLVRVQNENTNSYIGWCLEPNDLVASKLSALREKDYDFADRLLTAGLVDPSLVLERISKIPLRCGCSAEALSLASSWVHRWQASHSTTSAHKFR